MCSHWRQQHVLCLGVLYYQNWIDACIDVNTHFSINKHVKIKTYKLCKITCPLSGSITQHFASKTTCKMELQPVVEVCPQVQLREWSDSEAGVWQRGPGGGVFWQKLQQSQQFTITRLLLSEGLWHQHVRQRPTEHHTHTHIICTLHVVVMSFWLVLFFFLSPPKHGLMILVSF